MRDTDYTKTKTQHRSDIFIDDYAPDTFVNTENVLFDSTNYREPFKQILTQCFENNERISLLEFANRLLISPVDLLKMCSWKQDAKILYPHLVMLRDRYKNMPLMCYYYLTLNLATEDVEDNLEYLETTKQYANIQRRKQRQLASKHYHSGTFVYPELPSIDFLKLHTVELESMVALGRMMFKAIPNAPETILFHELIGKVGLSRNVSMDHVTNLGYKLAKLKLIAISKCDKFGTKHNAVTVEHATNLNKLYTKHPDIENLLKTLFKSWA